MSGAGSDHFFHNSENEMESKWYEEFFYGLALDMWRNAIGPEQTREEAGFIADVLGVASGAAILDVPCGLGRHSLVLARLGYQVTGLDLSAESLTEASSNASVAGLSIDWIYGDMKQVDQVCGQERFEGAFCFGNSFAYSDYQDALDFLSAIRRSLKAGSVFVLETGLAAESLLPNLQLRRWLPLGDLYMLSEATYKADLSQLQTRYTFIRGSAIQTGTATYSIYTVAELKRMFAMCGLTVEAIYGSTKRAPYSLNSRLILVSRTKNG